MIGRERDKEGEEEKEGGRGYRTRISRARPSVCTQSPRTHAALHSSNRHS